MNVHTATQHKVLGRDSTDCIKYTSVLIGVQIALKTHERELIIAQ